MNQHATSKVLRVKADTVDLPVVAMNLRDFAAEARRIVDEARQEARTILAGAYDRAAAVAKESADQAYAEGFAQGRSDGHAEGLRQAGEEASEKIRTESAGLVALAEKITRQIAAATDELARCQHKELLRFAMELAEKIVTRVAPADIATARKSLRRALELAGRNCAVTIRVNPEQMAALQQYCEQLCSAWNRTGQVRLVADEKVSPGGALAVTEAGKIDATVETQLARVIDALVGDPAAAEDTARADHQGTEPDSEDREKDVAF